MHLYTATEASLFVLLEKDGKLWLVFWDHYREKRVRQGLTC